MKGGNCPGQIKNAQSRSNSQGDKLGRVIEFCGGEYKNREGALAQDRKEQRKIRRTSKLHS
jgi:hypothetical protein